MTTPNSLLLGEGVSSSDHARLMRVLADPTAVKLLSAGFNPASQDPALYRLMSESQDLTPRQHRTLFSAIDRSERPHLMGLAPGDVHIPTGLANQFVMYANRECIADEVLPVVPVAKKSDAIWETGTATLATIANTQLAGSRARPNEIPYGVDHNLSFKCRDQGLIDFNDYETIANADTPLNPRVLSAIVLKSFLDLAREYRVAGVVFNSANYGASTAALSGANRWDQPSSDPVAEMIAQKETVFATPNTLVLGGQVWPKLRTHPRVLQYILGRASASSIGDVPLTVQLELFAALLEIDRVVVGRAKYVASQEPGAAMSYLWGKSAALIRVEPNPNARMTQCFGYTYRFGGKTYRNEVIADRMPGLMGGEYLKMTHSDDEVPIGQGTTGYFWDTVIS